MESRWSGAFLQQALPVCVPSCPMAATTDMFPLSSSSDHMYVELTLRLQKTRTHPRRKKEGKITREGKITLGSQETRQNLQAQANFKEPVRILQ